MNRRHFLMAGGALLAQPLIPTFANAQSVSGKLYFGYDSREFGTTFGRKATDLLYMVDSNLDYTLINEPNRNTIAATELVKKSQPDGHTLLQVTGTVMSLFTCLYRNLPYDPIADFTPVTFLGEHTYMLVVGPLVDPSVKTLDDYVSWVFDNPEYRDFGAVLYGSETHLAGLVLAQEKKVALRTQAYGGTSLMVQDLLDGVLAAGFVSTENAHHLVSSGHFRMLGVCCNQRYAAWPDVPTMSEQGVEMDFRGWYGWMAPSSIGVDTLTALKAATTKMHQLPEFQALQAEHTLNSLEDMSSAELKTRIYSEIEKCRELYSRFQLSRANYLADFKDDEIHLKV